MTDNPFASPPEGSFLLVPNGVPALVGPWSISIRADRELAVNNPHLVSFAVREMNAGSYHLTLGWRYRLADGGALGTVRYDNSTRMLPRPKAGNYMGGVLHERRISDAGAITRGRRGQRKNTGVVYTLDVRHLYAPGAELTMERITEDQRALRTLVGDTLASVENRLASIGNDLSILRGKVIKPNDL